MTDFHCRICGVIHELPKDAVEFGKGHRGPYRKFRFRMNGMVVHDMRTGKDGGNSKAPPQPGLAQHTRWHTKRGYKKQDCKFCYPESVPEQPPQVPDETVNAVVPEPQKPEPEVKQSTEPEPTDKITGIGRTQMEAAFERLRGSNRCSSQQEQ